MYKLFKADCASHIRTLNPFSNPSLKCSHISETSKLRWHLRTNEAHLY